MTLTLHGQIIVDELKKRLNYVLDNLIITSVNSIEQRAYVGIRGALEQFLKVGDLADYTVDSVIFEPNNKPLRQVDGLPLTAQPGDALITPEDEYRGIIISHDGVGNGVILQPPNTGEVTGKLNIQVQVKTLRAAAAVVLKFERTL